MIASIALSSTLLVSCLSIKERDPRLEGPPASDNPGVLSFFGQVFSAIRRLPPQIRKICEVQFFSWIGWFPFLFYITTYIGQLYVNPHLVPDLSEGDLNDLWEEATRVGTFALLIYAIVSFVANTFLPFLIIPSYKPINPDESSPASLPSSPIGLRRNSLSFGNLPLSASSTNISGLLPVESRKYGSSPPTFLSRILTKVQIPGFTLRRAWLLSQILFAVCMASTFFISTPQAATVMAAVVGIPWALTIWAPFALISAEIARREELSRGRHRRLGQHEPFLDSSGEEDPSKRPEEGESSADQAGIILGLHNVAISTPQILATLISSVVFKALQKPRGVPGDNSVGWVLRMGGVAALVAAAFTARLSESGDEL